MRWDAKAWYDSWRPDAETAEDKAEGKEESHEDGIRTAAADAGKQSLSVRERETQRVAGPKVAERSRKRNASNKLKDLLSQAQAGRGTLTLHPISVES